MTQIDCLGAARLHGENETETFGAHLASVLQPGDCLLLSGALGAGKSTLARGLIRHFYPGEIVTSPTFTFSEIYADKEPAISHFDLYRLEEPDEIWELGLEEALEGTITIIEWPERAATLLPENALAISLTIDGDARSVLVKGNKEWKARLSGGPVLIDWTANGQ